MTRILAFRFTSLTRERSCVHGLWLLALLPILGLILLALPIISVASLPQAQLSDGTGTFVFTEDFTTYAYKDADYTTADWNVFKGVLKLPRQKMTRQMQEIENRGAV